MYEMEELLRRASRYGYARAGGVRRLLEGIEAVAGPISIAVEAAGLEVSVPIGGGLSLSVRDGGVVIERGGVVWRVVWANEWTRDGAAWEATREVVDVFPGGKRYRYRPVPREVLRRVATVGLRALAERVVAVASACRS